MNEKDVSLRLSRRQLVALAGGMLALEAGSMADALSVPAQAGIETHHGSSEDAYPRDLRCEYRTDPLGIDAVRPRISWTIHGSRRGERQTAYQVLVASSASLLEHGRGDLWDTGKVASDQCSPIVYSGRPLTSRAQCYWKVRIWDQAGASTEWSVPAHWSVGLLRDSDWSAQWITDAVLADPANRPRTPIHCYRSEIAHTALAEKWIMLDLGRPKTFDGTCLQPAKPAGLSGDIATVMYPVRFKIETANAPDFHDATVIVDKTDQDVRPPRQGFIDPERYRFSSITARYIRLNVSRLARWDGDDYALALGRFQVFAGDIEIAARATVSASDSVETDNWSCRFLTDPSASVAYAPIPPALLPHMGGVDSVSRAPLLRRAFRVDGGVKNATLFCAARGFYEAHLNGARVGDDVLAPGYTEYDRRIEYRAYDVTHLLRIGPNVIGALLGYGWYAGHMNLSDNEYIYGYFPQLLAQLEIDYTNGRHDVISSGAGWKSTLDGPVRWSDLLDGEGYDCRREMPGWDKASFDDAEWHNVTVIPRDGTPLVWQRAQPAQRMQELQPVGFREVAPGVTVFDLGQEISGWGRIQAQGPAGARVTVRHAEQRHADGSLNRDNLWGTAAEEDYILDGHGQRTLEPHFTSHGFRFVEVTGLTKPPTPDTVVGVHIRTGARRAGRFNCANPLFNKLMDASRWTQQNLLFDVPAGCAGRAERLAWTGDIRPCVQTALFHFDSAAFFEKYAADLRADQTADGRFTDICPHAHLRDTDVCVGSPGWADAGISLPWTLYLNTGDKRILSDHYQAARRWVDFVHRHNPDLLWTEARGMGWGDWLSPGPPTPQDIGSTAFFAHDADLVSRMASVLGYGEDAAHYGTLFQGIRTAFVRRFVSPEGVIYLGGDNTQDVTSLLQSLARNGTTVTVGNDVLGGDPALNVVKHLSLTVRTGGQETTQNYPEGATITFKQPTVEIIKAIYGASPSDVQGSYALALHFGLLDEPLRTLVVKRLAQVIARDGGHPTTGFWSSVELLLALTDNGRHDIAAQMLNLTTMPSWGYMVQGDGTTCWESFDADAHQLSLNHWTHSAIGEWLWRHIAGIAPDPSHPGYRNMIIRPRPCAEVNTCDASFESSRGPISVAWSRRDSAFTLAVTVPANSTATVFIPAEATSHISEGGRTADGATGIHLLRRDINLAVYHVESGTYRFAVV